MNIEIVVAHDSARGIGFKGRLPWPHNKKDMARFQELTGGPDKIIVMGRKTYEDILDAASEKKRSIKDIKKKGILKKRRSIVITSFTDELAGAATASSLRDIINEHIETNVTLVVIGGERLFIEAISWASAVHVTIFDKQYQCDRQLPPKFIDGTWTVTPIEKFEVEGECDAYFASYTRSNPLH